jgi:hypothetical protein
VSARYIFVTLTATGGTALQIGVFAAGLAFQPTFGREYGSGRVVTETGAKERLLSGAFGINAGVRAGGYQWTFGELTDAEVETLYDRLFEIGETVSCLMVEDPDVHAYRNARIHWGLLGKIEAYERFAPGASRWSLRIEDWA